LPEGSVGAITISSCERLRYNEWLKSRFKMDGPEEETPVKTNSVRVACDNGMSHDHPE
jgi:hypothetical protein